jgi:magnesium transporter
LERARQSSYPTASFGVVQLLTSVSDDLRGLVERDEFFWLDLLRPSADEVARLETIIGLDHRALEHTLEFGRIPDIRRYHDHVELVFFGAEQEESGSVELIEVHIYVSGGWVVTIRQDDSHALDELREEIQQSPPQAESLVVARILNALADTFDDLLDPLDEMLSSIERQVFESGGRSRVTRELRREILDHRRSLFTKRRLLRRQRDYIERTIGEIEDLPGLEPSQRHDLRDVSGQMIRVTDRVDDALDRLAAALDLLSSTVSNRLNAIMERLTVVATIFLPLTVLTGFFGMNFAWLVKKIDTPVAFWLLGVGLVVASGAGVAAWVSYRIERGDLDA